MHCRETKDLNTSVTVSKRSKNANNVTVRTKEWSKWTLQDSSMNDEWKDGVSHAELKSSCHVPFERIIFKKGAMPF